MSRKGRGRQPAAVVEEQEGLPFRVDMPGMMRDLQGRVTLLQDDLRRQAHEVAPLRQRLGQEFNQAQEGGRTREPFQTWLEPYLTQVAVAWVLSCVFVRYLEDNGMLGEPHSLPGQAPSWRNQVWLAGPGPRLALAQEALESFFRRNPRAEHLDYLKYVFGLVADLPGCRDLLGSERNPLWLMDPSGDAAKDLLDFWQQVDPDSGALRRVFGPGQPDDGHPAAGTRFLGDLYQDLSEAARHRYALLQTPDFVEEFILERTLDPAVEEFGLDQVRLLDPTCGSGHFLLGAFHRLLARWQQTEPGTAAPVLADRALRQVCGVDLNPFAVAITRFRLLVAAVRASGYRRLREARDFRMNLAVGDSLVYGRQVDRRGVFWADQDYIPDAFARGEASQAREILAGCYHAVVGNPPYITDKDPQHRDLVRSLYASCHGKFSLGAPFTERFFHLARAADRRGAGYVGFITTNSFMKREFGAPLIQEFLPTVDLTHVLDTSGAYIPGHGTPTVILFGRSRPPVRQDVRAVLGIRGEPETPADPAEGKVWSSITGLVDHAGRENEFVTVQDVPRAKLARHPWSLQGGGAGDLLEAITGRARTKLGDVADSIGFASFPGQDDVFLVDRDVLQRFGVEEQFVRPLVFGELVRDWQVESGWDALVPYRGTDLIDFAPCASWARFLWPFQSSLEGIKTFGDRTRKEVGDSWWGWYRWIPDKLRTPLSITFAFVATHNHFVLDRGGKVFKQSAPVIKLPPGATEDQHLALCGLLNSAVACFWLKQSCSGKHKGDGGSAHADPAYQRFEFDGTKLQQFPIPADPEATLPLARRLDWLSRQAQDLLPGALCARQVPTRAALEEARGQEEALFGRRVALQEELDWLSYRLYGLLDEAETPLSDPDTLPEVRLGQRAFEIAMARLLAAASSAASGGTGKERFHTTWFERHGSTPITEIPPHWPAAYRQVVQRRLDLLSSHPFLRLLEKPEHKRRWNREPWAAQEQQALRAWLLDRLESPRYWGGAGSDGAGPQAELQSCSTLADRAVRDPQFRQVATLYAGRDDFDALQLVADLVASEAVPYLAPLRYTESGLRKRRQWEEVWDLQRREDRGELSVGQSPQGEGSIPVPPKYRNEDFRPGPFWKLRGALDVPKERFISYPGAERGTDRSLVVGWAGWDTVQRAEALAAWYVDRRDHEGWEPARLVPLLAGLQELVPWLLQWHNAPDPELGPAGDYFATFIDAEARRHGTTAHDLQTWLPPPGPARARPRRA